MAPLQSFHTTLQHEIKRSDNTWDYRVTDLPKARSTNPAKLVKTISFVSSLKAQYVEIRLVSAPSNRITWSEPLDRFLLLSVADFRLREVSEDGVLRLSPARDSTEYVSRLLKAGISLNGVCYNFFGHSNSQLKSRSCFMFAASKEEISAKVEALGDFSKMKSVGKKVKRIGLMFSSAEMALELQPDRYQDIDDITSNGYNFTDGCGLISMHLARQLVQRRNITYRNLRYLPSVFQIRYRGYKGVLTLCLELEHQIQVQFRESMRKFKDVSDLFLSVVDHSRPYAFGFLNDEVVLLLHALGISTDVLCRKQRDYLDFLRTASSGDLRTAFQFLSLQNEIGLAEKLLMDGVEAVLPALRRLVRQEYTKMLNKRDEQRCRIMIQDSRLLFGICDPTGKDGFAGRLTSGTCFVRVTSDRDGQARTLVNTEVIVTRNPCLHPGDIQKFRVVDVPGWSHLVDCIVFPTKGARPSADLMSGGDLDGDKFFVSWDPEIIPQQISEPAQYPGVKERHHFTSITSDDRAEFFAKYTNASLGRVKNLYLKWARRTGPLSAECQQLNRLFSQCVDGNRIDIPKELAKLELEDPPDLSDDSQPFILDSLHDEAKEIISRATDSDWKSTDISDDFMDIIAGRESIPMSEFELIQLVLRKCDQINCSFLDYAAYFDYSTLSDEQQAWLLSTLPPTKGISNLVRNGLLQSELLSPEESRRFGLDGPNLRWKPVFASGEDRMGRFLDCASRCLETFHKKLIILQANERLTLMIFVPQKIARATEVKVDSSVRVFALPHSSGRKSGANYRVVPTKVNSRLYCDDSVFQLYERKRGNTFVFLGRGAVDKSSLSAMESEGDRRRQMQKTVEDSINSECIASIALNKINEPIQRHVGRINKAGVFAAEIFVISNRDIKSMRLLDEWLNYIDTGQIHPLFKSTTLEYRVPQLDSIDRTALSPAVASIVCDQKLSSLWTMCSSEDLRICLRSLIETGQRNQLQGVYTEIFEIVSSGQGLLDNLSSAKVLLDCLPSAPFLTALFLESSLWKQCKNHLIDDDSVTWLELLSELILAISELRAFVTKPFTLALDQLEQITVQQLAEIFQLLALSVEQPEYALDLILECIEPACLRLLRGATFDVQQLVKTFSGIALEHIDEAKDSHRFAADTLMLQPDGFRDGFEVVKANLRIDSVEGPPKVGDHIRFLASSRPTNAPLQQPYTMDALVIKYEKGEATFRCIHRPPTYLSDCAWKYKNCGSFVTSHAMLDAVVAFYGGKEDSCGLYNVLSGHSTTPIDSTTKSQASHASLNSSQNKALTAALDHQLVLLWGPPGTGKTHTLVVILNRLLQVFEKSRFLITAPTHNAVDNILQRFVNDGTSEREPLRVTTDLNKVSPALRRYTCDAMVGKDLSEGFGGRREAQRRVKASKLIFTTCVGAALGLLRTECFDIVIVDEASQQTEPETLIPLTKGCNRAILVGDHVQLRATVQQHAIVMGFDVSLFERLYSTTDIKGAGKVMLDTQYRMHPDICVFSSAQFYEGQLQTAKHLTNLQLTPSQFRWPQNARKVFVQCSHAEDLGRKSKSNSGQVELCRAICNSLVAMPTPNLNLRTVPQEKSSAIDRRSEITILTPYTRQRELLKAGLSGYEISSIDGYQGREADIIIYVTVRCNVHNEIGFLEDLRRLNVAMTRAKAGVIIIGDRTTLIGPNRDGNITASKNVWNSLLAQCTTVHFPHGTT